jgi:hypothetical protein
LAANRDLHGRLVAVQKEIAAKAVEAVAHEDFLENAANITSHERSTRFKQLLELTENIEGLDNKLSTGRAELRHLQRALLLSGFELHVDNDN